MKKQSFDYSNLENLLQIVFTQKNNIDELSKEELILRDAFIKQFEQKYYIYYKDFEDQEFIKKYNDFSYEVKIKNKKLIYFISIKNESNNENDLKFIFNKEQNDFVKKNTGKCFIYLYSDNNFILLNTKDYFDLYLIKENEDKFILNNHIEDEDIFTIFKKIFRKSTTKK